MVVVVDMISASVVSGQDAAQCSSNYPTSCQMLVVAQWDSVGDCN